MSHARLPGIALTVVVVLLVPRMRAAGLEGFAMWRAAELQQREAALSKKVGEDHSARETLAAYKTHRFRLLYRDHDGRPEQHDKIVDVVIVQSGSGTLLLGGKMRDSKGNSTSGEYLGSGIDGGERHPIGAGDIIHIPAGIPHSFLVPEGGHITYVLVKFPTDE